MRYLNQVSALELLSKGSAREECELEDADSLATEVRAQHADTTMVYSHIQ
jgi:hypothetical protein